MWHNHDRVEEILSSDAIMQQCKRTAAILKTKQKYSYHPWCERGLSEEHKITMLIYQGLSRVTYMDNDVSSQFLCETCWDLIGMCIFRRKGAALSFVWPSWMFYNKAGKQRPGRVRPGAGDSVREAPGGLEMLGYAYSCRRKTSQPNDEPFILTTVFQCR